MSSYPNAAYLIGLAISAGNTISRNLCLGMPRETKEDGSPLTATDTQLNQLVLEAIRKDFPHVRVIGEEGSHEVEGAECTVYFDPVDGTVLFSRGVPISTFVMAVEREGKPVAAVIHDPFMDRTWSAEKGRGTTLLYADGFQQHVRVSKHATLKGAHISMCWGQGTEYNLGKVCEKLIEKGASFSNLQSIAYAGGLLASGEMEGTIFPSRDGIETMAMHLIAAEAGGKVTNIYGHPMRYGPKGEICGHIITNGCIHDELRDLVLSCQPER